VAAYKKAQAEYGKQRKVYIQAKAAYDKKLRESRAKQTTYKRALDAYRKAKAAWDKAKNQGKDAGAEPQPPAAAPAFTEKPPAVPAAPKNPGRAPRKPTAPKAPRDPRPRYPRNYMTDVPVIQPLTLTKVIVAMPPHILYVNDEIPVENPEILIDHIGRLDPPEGM